jgi:hypothetical protein
MDEKIMQEILHELFSSLEDLETQSRAILQFLKDKGITNEKELAPYFERAGTASSVRWRAVRARIDYLLSSALKTTEQDAKKESQKALEKKHEPSSTGVRVPHASVEVEIVLSVAGRVRRLRCGRERNLSNRAAGKAHAHQENHYWRFSKANLRLPPV